MPFVGKHTRSLIYVASIHSGAKQFNENLSGLLEKSLQGSETARPWCHLKAIHSCWPEWPTASKEMARWLRVCCWRPNKDGSDVRWGCVGKGQRPLVKGLRGKSTLCSTFASWFHNSQFRTGPLCEVRIFANTPCIHPYPVIWGGVQLQILEAWWPWWPWLTITIKVPLRLPIWHWPLLKFDPSWFIAAFRRIPWTQRRTICSNRRLLFIIPAWHVEPSSAMFNLHTIRGI